MTTDYDDTELRTMLADALARIAILEKLITPASKLDIQHTITSEQCGRIVKLRADLFYNEHAKQGTPKHDLKVFVWLDTKKGQRGHLSPLHFWLVLAERSNDGTGDDVLAQTIRQAEPHWMVGCITHKTNGTTKERDHVAIMNGESLVILIREDLAVRFDSHEVPKQTPNGKSPIARFWWNKPKAEIAQSM